MREVLGGFDSVGEIRGVGLMIGIELVADKATKRGSAKPHSACARVEAEAWERGLYVRAMGTEVVGLAPPLTIDRACADQIVAILAESIAAMEADVLVRRSCRGRGGAPRAASTRSSSCSPRWRAGSIRARRAGSISSCSMRSTGESGGTWVLAVRERRALDRRRVAEEQAGAAVTIRADAASYLQIVNGELSGAEAFNTRRLMIDGDLAQMAGLAKLGLT